MPGILFALQSFFFFFVNNPFFGGTAVTTKIYESTEDVPPVLVAFALGTVFSRSMSPLVFCFYLRSSAIGISAPWLASFASSNLLPLGPGNDKGHLGLLFLITWFTDPPTRFLRIWKKIKNKKKF